ncbi:MAG: 3-oxoacid CoA-transferase subunit A [Spirochaetales bacterium]|nr:3-oxoacid CoA-transferase subunit A [Spirochaetales bacterium]
MSKLVSVEEAVDLIKEDMTIMVGGFMGCGNPHKIIDVLIKKGTKNLTMICNDASWPGYGVGKLVTNRQLKKLIASHIGLNPEVAQQMAEGSLKVELIPQGTLAERIRCGGNGTGGFLTPTGIGTVVEEGKQKITINGIEYLLELPMRADIALIAGYKVDKNGNVWYKGNTRNFNVVMATAANLVIAEGDHICEIGDIEPENVVTPSIFVDYVVERGAA